METEEIIKVIEGILPVGGIYFSVSNGKRRVYVVYSDRPSDDKIKLIRNLLEEEGWEPVIAEFIGSMRVSAKEWVLCGNGDNPGHFLLYAELPGYTVEDAETPEKGAELIRKLREYTFGELERMENLYRDLFDSDPDRREAP